MTKAEKRKYQHEWYLANCERLKAKARENHMYNRERNRIATKKWREKNREKITAKRRAKLSSVIRAIKG